MQLLDFYSELLDLKKSFNLPAYVSLVSEVEAAHAELIHDALSARGVLQAYREDLSLLYPAYTSPDFALNSDLVALCKTVSIVVEGSTLTPSIYHACLDVLRWNRENTAYTTLRDMILELGVSASSDEDVGKLLLGVIAGGPLELPPAESMLRLISNEGACCEQPK